MVSKPWAVYALSAFSGVAVWVGLMLLSGTREGWDSPLYFPVGMPLVVLVAAISGFLVPIRAWRWGLLPMGAQAAVATASNPTANLLPLGLALFSVLAVPCILGAYLGVLVKKVVSCTRPA